MTAAEGGEGGDWIGWPKHWPHPNAVSPHAWECPRCRKCNAPHVSQCPCDPREMNTMLEELQRGKR